jgi:hypothetical protein
MSEAKRTITVRSGTGGNALVDEQGNPVKLRADQTVNPSSGKIYQKKAPKVRSPEFLRLSQKAEDARVALVTYCNNKSYTYDIEQKSCFGPDPKDKSKSLWIQDSDKELNELTRAQKSAKLALNEYKRTHEAEFRPEPPKQGNPSKRGKKRPTMAVQKPKASTPAKAGKPQNSGKPSHDGRKPVSGHHGASHHSREQSVHSSSSRI